ncbi:MAG: sigma-54-dependent Fis family transcriptional regulator [Deltaproteobacteria bacterium]|nr:sigma-54-dependent Fis family transcriptional regulator [Deltaproteobacteria bacterium]MCB9787555.1 sigma-54-dependent Fis family transcriptional regulator [Deltaproteobacteria bacterium]
MANSERRVLLVDDDPLVCALMEELLVGEGFEVETVVTGQAAIDRVSDGFRGVMVLDVLLPDLDGTAVFEAVKDLSSDVPVVFLTGYGSTDLALSTIQSGAFDFMDKAHVADRLAEVVGTAFDSLMTRDELAGASAEVPFEGIVTRSPQMRAVFRSLDNALDSKVTVLIRGESGTGKELIATGIHAHGPRRDGPFVTVNCASIPESLLEAELFGYERGAFTGAHGRKLGRFEMAHRGTLFLDEIGELQPALQAKLLRVIQERSFQRLGGLQTLQADVRILSATNRNLEEEVAAGRFREDLYYRLAVFTVHLPPLRERSGDVPLLVNHFVAEVARREARPVPRVDARAMELLASYGWPGNVRELENVISFAVVSAKGSVLTIADLPAHFLRAVALVRGSGEAPHRDGGGLAGRGGPPGGAAYAHASLAAAVPARAASAVELRHFPTLAEVETQHILAALAAAGQNKSRAAALLGISRTTLYRKLEEMG